MDDPVQAFDFARMFWGEESNLIYLEIAFRTIFIYLYAFLAIRFIAKRAVGQLSLLEFFLVIALGSAVGDPMFYPEVPLLNTVLVITIVILINKFISDVVIKIPILEDLIDPKPIEIIRNGVINKKYEKISAAEIYRSLRLKDISNLAQVRAAYLESDGSISILKEEQNDKIGLPIIPPIDLKDKKTFIKKEHIEDKKPYACVNCGTVKDYSDKETFEKCTHCNHLCWLEACSGNQL